MYRRALLMSVVLISAVSMIAQSSNETGPGGQGPGGKIVVTGCVKKEGGSYTITDKSSGYLYTLGGDRSLFEKHNGQEVTITARRTEQAESGGLAGAKSPVRSAAPGIIVQDLKVVSTGSCSK